MNSEVYLILSVERYRDRGDKQIYGNCSHQAVLLQI